MSSSDSTDATFSLTSTSWTLHWQENSMQASISKLIESLRHGDDGKAAVVGTVQQVLASLSNCHWVTADGERVGVSWHTVSGWCAEAYEKDYTAQSYQYMHYYVIACEVANDDPNADTVKSIETVTGWTFESKNQ